jgi:Spy/CpxP family protein refolding chaperone
MRPSAQYADPARIHLMKIAISFIALLASVFPLLAEGKTHTAGDPFEGAFFPPELVLLARDQIGMTQEQLKAFQDRVERAQPRSDELRSELERESATLSSMVKQEHVDEAAIIAQLDKVLDVERALKHLHVGLLAAIKNILTSEQQTRLREIAKDGGARLGEEARRRLSEKVERVKAGAQKWAESGRDPSEIARAMEEKFKPLIDAGKIIEAEAELDRLLDQLNQDTK